MPIRSRGSRGLFKARICFAVLFLISFFAMLFANRKVLLFGAWPCNMATPLFSNEGFETYWAQNCWQIADADFKKFDYLIIDLTDQPRECIDSITNKASPILQNAIIMRSARPGPDTALHMSRITDWQKNAPYRFFRWAFYLALCGLGAVLALGLFETLHGRKEIS
jgi:hypothetical protein